MFTVIRVGKSSKIRLKNAKACRALSIEQVNRYVEANSGDIDLLVFEDAVADELEKIQAVYKSSSIHTVAYSAEEVDSELVDLYTGIGISYISGLWNLQEYIQDNLGFDVLTHIRKTTPVSNVVEIIEEPGEATEEEVVDSAEEEAKHKAEEEARIAAEKAAEEEARRQEEKRREEERAELESALAAAQSTDDTDQSDEYESDVAVVISTKGDLSQEIDTDDLFKDLEAAEESKAKEEAVSNELKQKMEEQAAKIKELRGRLDSALTRVNELGKIRESIENERAVLENKLSRIMMKDDVMEVIIGSWNREDYEVKIRELEKDKQDLQIQLTELDRLNERITALGETIQKKDDEALELKAEITRLRDNTELDNAKQKTQNEATSRMVITELVGSLITRIDSLTKELESKENAYRQLKTDLGMINKSYADANEQIEMLKAANRRMSTDLNGQIESLTQQNETLRKNNEERLRSISALQLEKSEAEMKLPELESRIKSLSESNAELESKLKQANNKVESQSLEIEGYRAAETERAHSEATDPRFQAFHQKLLEAQEKVAKQDSIITTLTKQNNALRNTQSGTASNLEFSCDYKGGAKIIMVAGGGGSCGVTTTAVSICNKLRRHCLLIDFNLLSPKAETLLGQTVSPIIKGLPGMPNNQILSTGLGAFFVKDASYFIGNENRLIQVAMRARDGYQLDYISGLYLEVSTQQYITADYTALFNHLGSRYNYIVLDMGIFGVNEVSTALVKMFSQIAYKNVFVTQHNDSDMRSLRLRMQTKQLNAPRSIWMLNMSRNSNLSQIMRNSLGNTQFVIMPRKMDMFGEAQTFDRIAVVKDKLSQLCDMLE